MSKEYSASIVSKGFWILEFKRYVGYLKDGLSHSEIRTLQNEKNVFQAASKAYGIKIIGEMKRRTETLPEVILDYFSRTDVWKQKIINLLSVLMNDKLFFEYVYHSYRYEMILNTVEYSSSTARKFLSEKASQSEEIAGFSQASFKRMVGVYATYLREAGLLESVDGKTQYKRVYLDYELEQLMKDNNLELYVKAIKGEFWWGFMKD